MKKTILFLLLTVVSLAVSAQDAQPKDSVAFKFGYLSYDSVMVAVPDYTELKTNMAQLREQYEAEQKRVENDFNKKYEEFLDGQASFPKTILQKRQSELQEMLDRNIEFKKQSQKMLSEAEANMMEVHHCPGAWLCFCSEHGQGSCDIHQSCFRRGHYRSSKTASE